MGVRRRPSWTPPLRQHALTGIALISVAFGAACMQTSSRTEPGAVAGRAVQLTPGEWAEQQELHCDLGICGRWYEIEVPERARLDVQIFALAGKNDPDCELHLRTVEGDPLKTRSRRIGGQRRWWADLDAGIYRIEVASSGENQGLFDYDMVAKLEEPDGSGHRAPKPATKPAPPPPPPPMEEDEGESDAGDEEVVVIVDDEPAPLLEPDVAQEPEPELEPEPEPEPVLIVGEILDSSEQDDGNVLFLDIGESQGVLVGMQGELFEGDVVLGRVEVIRVLRSGCRALVVESSGEIGIETTLVRFEGPPQELEPTTGD